MSTFRVTEYSASKRYPPIEVEAENGADAICKALNLTVLPFGYAHDGKHMACHAQFSRDGTTGAHATLVE